MYDEILDEQDVRFEALLTEYSKFMYDYSTANEGSLEEIMQDSALHLILLDLFSLWVLRGKCIQNPDIMDDWEEAQLEIRKAISQSVAKRKEQEDEEGQEDQEGP